MITGTTPKHTFELLLESGEPLNVTQIKDLRITYNQNGRTILIKKKEDCLLYDNTISVQLTQEETLKFFNNGQIEIEIKIITINNSVVINPTINIPVFQCLNKEVLK